MKELVEIYSEVRKAGSQKLNKRSKISVSDIVHQSLHPPLLLPDCISAQAKWQGLIKEEIYFKVSFSKAVYSKGKLLSEEDKM